jgi:hypothetical protein
MNKIIRGLAILLIAVVSLMSCNSGQIVEYGSIQITLPNTLEAKAIDRPIAVSHVDTYTIIAYNVSRNVIMHIDDVSSNTNMITVPVDTYNVVVLAGNDAVGYETYLGGGYITNVTVVQDVVTPVTIILDNLDMEVITPATVTAGADISVSVTLNTNVPVVVLNGLGSIRGPDNTTHQIIDTEANGAWSGTVVFTAPGAPGEDTLTFVGSTLHIEDTAYGITISDLGRNWLTPTEYDNNPLIQAETVFPITIIAAQTGIDITIEWG